jgi:hypothetical protein
MNAYQNFLDFFLMHNKERLDGLDESYFADMTQEERAMAFAYLLKKVEAGGTEESVHGLFLADKERAFSVLKELLKSNTLREDAEIAAAWNLYRAYPDSSLLPIFIRLMSSEDRRIRAKAAYYIPSDISDSGVISALQGMIRTETDMLASINATNKLLECYGITRELVTKEEFSRFYRGLRSDDVKLKEITFKQLNLRPRAVSN